MLNDIRLEYDVHWMLDPDSIKSDPFNIRLRDLGRYLMYRAYLVPGNELIAERLLDLQDVGYIHEIHWIKIPHGQYSIRLEDVTGKIKLNATDIKLNGAMIPSLAFNL